MFEFEVLLQGAFGAVVPAAPLRWAHVLLLDHAVGSPHPLGFPVLLILFRFVFLVAWARQQSLLA